VLARKQGVLRLAFSSSKENANQNQNGNEALCVVLARLTLTDKSCSLLWHALFILILI
jgi:hypothetical protein